jgi:predicted HicB family RNase H-like nuclease
VKKDLKYFMGLPYVIELIQIPESEGGGFSASMPEVGRFAFVGDGDTPQEAIDNLNALKEEHFSEYLEKGIHIPEPKKEEDFSGKFVLRISPVQHMRLNEEAKKAEISLNNYIKAILEEHISNGELLKEIKSLKEDIKTQNSSIKKDILDLQYQFQILNESISGIEPYPVVKRCV